MSNAHQLLILQLEKVVERACAHERNVFGYGIWTHHIKEVARHAKRLAPLFSADPQVVEIAALLHDLAPIQDQRLYDEHHVHGAMEAQKILERFDYPREKIEAVKDCILAHRARVPHWSRSPEADCLANADAVAHLEQVSSLLYLVFVRYEMEIDEGTAWVREKLERSWNKLHPSVQETMADTFRAAQMTLNVRILDSPTGQVALQRPSPNFAEGGSS